MLTPRQTSILAWAIFALLGGLLAARVSGQTVDDFFITYHYAQNLVAGDGFVFNPGERVLATTAPGWGLFLALLHIVTGLPLPDLGTWAFAACLVLLAVLLLAEGRRLHRGIETFVGGVLLVSCSFLWPHNGFEYPAALLLLLLATFWVDRYPKTAGLVAGFAVWCRPDGVLLVACLGLLLLFEGAGKRRRLATVVPFAAASGGIVVLGMALAWWYYGQPLPVTLAAKQAQGDWLMPAASGWGFWPRGLRWLSGTYAGPWTPLLAVIGSVGFWPMLRFDSRLFRMLAASSAVVVVSYPFLGVPFYTWYAIPLLIGWLYGYPLAVGDLLRWLLRRREGSAMGTFTLRRWVAAGLLIFLAGFPAYVGWRSWRGYQLFDGFPRCQLYRDAGTWLAEHAGDNASFAFVEVGTIAFYSRLPVRDLTGLVTPESRPFAADGDLAGAFAARPAPWLVTTDRLDGMMGPVLDLHGIPSRPSHTLTNRDGTLSIYRLDGF